MSNPTTYLCPKCWIVKDASEFGRGSLCDPCHSAKFKAIQARWYEKNREEVLAHQKANPRDPERRRQTDREWYAKNRERARAVKATWRANNPERAAEKDRATSRRRRARLRALPTEPYTVEDLLERDGTVCVLCEEELDFSARWPEPRAVTVEHLECLAWPDSPGDTLANTALACFECNIRRGDRPHPRAAAKRAALLAEAAA